MSLCPLSRARAAEQHDVDTRAGRRPGDAPRDGDIGAARQLVGGDLAASQGIEQRGEPLGDLFDGPVGVNLGEAVAGPVVADDRRDVAAKRVEAGVKDGGVVVGAAEQTPATHVADPGLGGRAKALVEGRLAHLAGEATGEAPGDLLRVDLEVHDQVELVVAHPEQVVDEPGLLDRPREPVEEDAVSAAQVDPVLDHLLDDLVGHEVAPLHVALRQLSRRRPRLHRQAQDVARRHMDEAEARVELAGVGPLPGTRRAEEGNVHEVSDATPRPRPTSARRRLAGWHRARPCRRRRQ